MTTYTNIDERYGEQVEATIADYQALNPEGKFIEMDGEIRELMSDTPGDYEIVAIATETIETQERNDAILSEYERREEAAWRAEQIAKSEEIRQSYI